MIFEDDQQKMREQLAYCFNDYAHGVLNSNVKFRDSEEMLVWIVFEIACNIRDAIALKKGGNASGEFALKVVEWVGGMTREEIINAINQRTEGQNT